MLPYSTTSMIRMLYVSIALMMCMYVNVPVHAQNMDNFTGLVSEGKIPKQITTNSATKYEVLKTEISRGGIGRRNQKRINKFNLEGTFAIDQMMRNGFVMFGDPVSTYINQVADKLFQADPDTRSKINFYTVRSPDLNAFATDRGDIFINIGLLTYLETEAQLAFILAHEITHWKEKHSMETFLEFEGINQSGERYKNKNDFSKLLKKSNYSKKNEEDADSEGLELFLQSDYSPESLVTVFNMMATAHAPYANEPFDPAFLSTKNFSVRDSLLLKRVNNIVFYEDSDSLSTHPGVKSRRIALNNALAKINSPESKKDFLVGEQKFNEIKELAKFEVCQIALEQYDYPEALYYTSLLDKKYPDNAFLKSVKLKTLYGLAKAVSALEDEDIVELGSTIQGELHQVYHLIEKFSDTEILSLAAAHLWEYCEENPEDEGMQLRLKDLMIELGDKNEGIIKALTGKQADWYLETAGIFKDQANSTRFEKMLKEKHPEPKEFTQKDLEEGFRLGLKKIMFVNPQYVSINLRNRKAPIQFIEAESNQEAMVKHIKENARKLKMTTKIMDVQSLKRNADASKFNDINTMEKWMEQKILLPDDMIAHNHNEAMAVMKKNNVKHVAAMGGLGFKDRNRIGMRMFIGFFPIYTQVLGPPMLYAIFKPDDRAMLYTIVVDATSREVVMSSYNVMRQKDRPAVVEQNIYWMLHQMATKAN